MNHYAHIVDMPGSVEFYDAVHAETLRRTHGNVEGLLVHLARATADGFQVVEVWTDRAGYERADRDILTPIITSLAGAAPSGRGVPGPRVDAFTPRGLVLPGGRVVF